LLIESPASTARFCFITSQLPDKGRYFINLIITATDSTNTPTAAGAAVSASVSAWDRVASVNAAKGSEKGNRLTHSETTLDTGNQLSLTSGRDTTLTGAQANGGSVKVDAGRNLTLPSEQDSDRYDRAPAWAAASPSV